MIPYKPISIHTPGRDATGDHKFFIFVALLILIFCTYISCSYCYQRSLANTLDTEMKRVVATGQEIMKYSRVQD